MPIEKILANLKELASKHNKANVKRIDFYQNLDVLNTWQENILKSYKQLVQPYHSEVFENINTIIKSMETFCFNYTDNFIKEINSMNEKIENENVLRICNDTIFFLSTLLIFEFGFEVIKYEYNSNYQTELTADIFISNLISKLETKSDALVKKYPPLKFIFLINNIYFIQSKISLSPFNKFITKYFTDSLTKNIKTYIESYLKSCWSEVDEVTFSDRENITALAFEQDGKTLRNSSRELIKKKFAVFNNAMKLHLDRQQRIQIIDRSIENILINENINHVAKRYEEFYNMFGNTGFTRFRNKYIFYNSGSDVTQDLKLYFMPDTVVKKNK
jgi:siroheme synthase (precorrin-2 oxidase/ferrochelatase)